MKTPLEINTDEITALARQFSLTKMETAIATKFLAGEKMPFALQNYPQEIRMFVAKMREQIEQPKNPFGKKDD